MPTSTLKSLANKAGVSLQDAEKAWDEAKSIAKKQKDESDPMFWGLVTKITKNKIGLKENKMGIEDKIDNYLGEASSIYDEMPISKKSMIGIKGTVAISSGILTPNVEKKFFSRKSFSTDDSYIVDYDTFKKISKEVTNELKAWHLDKGLPYYGK